MYNVVGEKKKSERGRKRDMPKSKYYGRRGNMVGYRLHTKERERKKKVNGMIIHINIETVVSHMR